MNNHKKLLKKLKRNHILLTYNFIIIIYNIYIKSMKKLSNYLNESLKIHSGNSNKNLDSKGNYKLDTMVKFKITKEQEDGIALKEGQELEGTIIQVYWGDKPNIETRYLVHTTRQEDINVNHSDIIGSYDISTKTKSKFYPNPTVK